MIGVCMRFWFSLLISTNVHVWTVALVSLAWPHSTPTLEPVPIEVRILKLPALPKPGDGGEVMKRISRIRPRQRNIPSVEYRVTISTSEPPPTAPFEKSISGEFVAHSEPARQEIERQAVQLSVNPKGGVETRKEDRFDLDPGGDPRPLIEIIQARIDEVTPLIHRTSGRCRYEEGVIKILFRISRYGYTDDQRIVRSSGPSCLEEAAEKVLHLAEPYPYVAGWVPVTIKFTL